MASSLSVILFISVCLLLVVGMMPRQTTVADGEVQIQSWLHRYRYRLDGLRGLEQVDPQAIAWNSTVRLFGVGWPMKRYGWFWNRKNGVFLALADRTGSLFLLELSDRKKVLISSDQGAALAGWLVGASG